MKTIQRFLALAAAGFFLLAGSQIGASPPWWEGAAEDVPAAAAQTGKPVVLYFHSPNAAECIRMEEETWAPMNPVWANLRFHWLKLEPRKDAEFFKYWQINQVPQVVVLDQNMSDQLRLRGFMPLDDLKESLERIERDVPSVYTTVNGSTLPASNPILDTIQVSRDPHKGHIYYENFDSYRLIGSISNPPFSPVAQAASRIDTKGGKDQTPCLVIDAADSGYSMIQIDVSRKFQEIEQVLGRIRVRAEIKALSKFGKVPVDVLALYVVRTDNVQDESEKEQMYFASLSEDDRNQWRSKEIISAPLDFRLNKAFILLSAQTPRTSFAVDELTVDLLPEDDLIPYVEVDSRVVTMAALNEASSGSSTQDDPNDFYAQLQNRAKVRTPSSVSNNLSEPVESETETQQSEGLGFPNRDGVLKGAERKKIAEHLKDWSYEDRQAFYQSRGIKGINVSFIEVFIRQLNSGKKKK